MKKIIHSLQVHAPPAKVYDALTTEAGLGGWWTTKVAVEPGEGGIVRFTFVGDFHPHMKQTRLEAGRLVRWTCVGGHDNWRDNTFSFALTGQDGGTRLDFVQEYARELSDREYGTYNFNWGYYLNSLKRLCEEGNGAPFVPSA